MTKVIDISSKWSEKNALKSLAKLTSAINSQRSLLEDSLNGSDVDTLVLIFGLTDSLAETVSVLHRSGVITDDQKESITYAMVAKIIEKCDIDLAVLKEMLDIRK